jgi:hypothetical protein
MKTKKKLLLAAALIIIVSAVYRVSPLREYGFAPQWAIAIFSGFLFADNKKWAFALPLLSMFLSDTIYQILYSLKLSNMQGFYGIGQIVNYVLFALVTCSGFFIKRLSFVRIATATLAAPTIYFLLSNFSTWIENMGYLRPKTFAGLMLCYTDGLPFYKSSVWGTIIFSAALFGTYYFFTRKKKQFAIVK